MIGNYKGNNWHLGASFTLNIKVKKVRVRVCIYVSMWYVCVCMLYVSICVHALANISTWRL